MRIDPGAEAIFDDLRQCRARNEDTRVHMKLKAGKTHAAGEVSCGNPFAYTPRDQRLDLAASGDADAARVGRLRRRPRQAQGMPYERRRLISRVVGAVTEAELCPRQAPGARRDQGAHRRAARAVR